MRLTEEESEIIARTVSGLLGAHAEVFVFGSRLDDNARGGDVDILVETAAPVTRLELARLKMTLETRLRLPVDILIQERGVKPTPFLLMARAQAQRLSRHL